MYNTVKELHIAVDNRLQQINSNRVKAISPELIDLRLNEAVYQFIETRTNPRLNSIQEGFPQSQKRYDDLQELLVSATLPIYVGNNSNVIAPLPYDYYKLVNDRSIRKYDCNGIDYNTVTSTPITYLSIPFYIDTTGVAGKYYTNMKLTVQGVDIYVSNSIASPYGAIGDLYNPDSRFIIINHLLDVVNSAGEYEIYWERYLDIYEQNRFIILPKASPIVTGGTTNYITYNSNFMYGTLKTINFNVYSNTSFTGAIEKPNALMEIDDIPDMLNNYYYSKSMTNKPISYIQQNSLVVFYNSYYIIKEVKIDYLKKPKLINLQLNQMCELSNMEVIVAIAVENILADKSYNFQLINNINQLKS